jgi:hypothetical protein
MCHQTFGPKCISMKMYDENFDKYSMRQLLLDHVLISLNCRSYVVTCEK